MFGPTFSCVPPGGASAGRMIVLIVLVLLGSVLGGSGGMTASDPAGDRWAGVRGPSLTCSICNDITLQDLDDERAQELRPAIRRQLAAEPSGDLLADEIYALFTTIRPSVVSLLVAFWGIPLLAHGTGLGIFLVSQRRRPPADDEEKPSSRLSRLIDG